MNALTSADREKAREWVARQRNFDPVPELTVDLLAELVAAGREAERAKVERLIVAVNRLRKAARDGIRPFASRSAGFMANADQFSAAYEEMRLAHDELGGTAPPPLEEPTP